jgi:hypothetical protein
LFIGLQCDNMGDKASKGRAARQHGSSNGRAKLTEADVIDIRASGDGLRALAGRFGVSGTLISLVRQRKAWGHI